MTGHIIIDIYLFISLGGHNLVLCANCPSVMPKGGLGVKRTGYFVYFGHMSSAFIFSSYIINLLSESTHIWTRIGFHSMI